MRMRNVALPLWLPLTSPTPCSLFDERSPDPGLCNETKLTSLPNFKASKVHSGQRIGTQEARKVYQKPLRKKEAPKLQAYQGHADTTARLRPHVEIRGQHIGAGSCFHFVSPGNGTWVVSLGGRCFDPLSHLASTVHFPHAQ